MGLYNCDERFVPAILEGRKRHTIRGIRKYPQKLNALMHLYTGLRHPGARLLFRAPCIKIEHIYIGAYIVAIERHELDDAEKESLAIADGFPSFLEMSYFWSEPKNRLPFEGDLLHWDFTRRVFE